ncbi:MULTISPECIES: hypothetical protein [Streptomyces]|uniref:Uncharacterized protein n=1 Tax=Streptomyces viridochromogenes TaxID=1938 RepID=A0A0L8JFQ4_STRVR|nr:MULTISPECIES: hypothetical protein [Streptomyces]KOG12508.1 hypothetical protein ADK34_32300 [Streptomyces viridochromogenes]
MTVYTFASWDRDGAAACLTDADDLSRTTPVRGSLAATAHVNGPPGRPVPVPALQVYGPGDVRALDPKEIVRVFPMPGTPDAEPTKFPLVEFERSEMPWLFTPLRAGDAGELRPWLSLVCVPTSKGRPQRRPGVPLPVLEVMGSELPDPTTLHLWAHAQTLPGHEDDPRRSVSRLLAPRKLEPHTTYTACLVPSFLAGKLAGLGKDTKDATLAPAWDPSPTARCELPVYFSWVFSTGEAGDFETLAARLKARPFPPRAGRRPLDVSRPGLFATGPGPVVQEVESALRAPGNLPRDPWPTGPQSAQWQQRLAKALVPIGDGTGDEDPDVLPPLYGGFHALRKGADPASTGWLDTLNLDPRWRVVAGLGARTVQADQEALMASAWRQLVDVQAANRFLDLARFARLVSGRLHLRHVKPLSADEVLRLATPLQSRISLAADTTLWSSVRASLLPNAMATTVFHRTVRPMGVLSRRVGLLAGRTADDPEPPFATVLSSVAASPTGLAVPRRDPDGTVAFRVAPEDVVAAERLAAVRKVFAPEDGAPDAWRQVAADATARSRLRDVTTEQLAATSPLPAAGLNRSFRLGALPEAEAPENFLARTRIDQHGNLVFPTERTGPAGLDLFTGAVGTGAAPGRFTGSWTGPWDTVNGGRGEPAGGWRGTCSGTLRVGPDRSGTWKGAFHGTWSNNAGAGGTDPTWLALYTGTWESGEERGVWRGVCTGTWDPWNSSSDGVFTGTWSSDTHHGTFRGTCPGDWDWDTPSSVGGEWSADCYGEILVAAEGTGGQDPWEPGQLKDLVDRWHATGTLPLDVFTGGGLLGGQQDRLPAPAVLDASPGNVKDMVVSAHDRVLGPSDAPPIPHREPFPTGTSQNGIVALTDPSVTVPAVVASRVDRPAGTDPQAPVQWAPVFPDPMWPPLSEQSNEWLFGGLEHIPADTAVLAVTNPPFVASYMVGLNHEFARELRWREYPTDQRGTYFASFWGYGTDHESLDTWKRELPLGAHLTGPPDRVVLLLRSALLRRYPGAIIYAAPLIGTEPDENGARHPIFRGGLDADTTMVGFKLTETELNASPWCFVIAEQPTEPRFGLDDPDPEALSTTPPPGAWGGPYTPPNTPGEANDWNDLKWSHLFDSKDAFLAATHAPGTLRPNVSYGGLVWGRSAAGTARQCFQQPVRVILPAKRLMAP